jgi:cyclically-permuted mutarotase family protein
MKLLLLCVGATLCALYGCQPYVPHPTNQEAQMPVNHHSTKQIGWSVYGKLPAPSGTPESLGVSAAFTGIIGNYLLVAGGANFPAGHPFFDQATKAYYSDIWLFDTAASTLQTMQHLQLPYPVAHGALVQTEHSVLLVGGQNVQGALSSILEVSLVAGEPTIRLWGQLPFSWHSGAATWYQGELFLFGGERNGQPTAGVCRFDSETSQCQELEPIPGPARVQFPAEQLSDTFYLFGGIDPKGSANNFTRTDAWAFDMKTRTWSQLPDVTFAHQAFSVSGGAAIALNDHEILLLGGVNLELFNNTLTQFSQLQGEELAAYKTRYFNLTTEEINFSRRQLVFNSHTNQWGALPDLVPFTGGAGPLTLARTARHIYWIGGETKPGVRSPMVYRGFIAQP